MRVLAGHDAMVAAFVASHIPQMTNGPGFGPSAAIGVVNVRGELVAGVVFHGFHPEFSSIEVSFAAITSRWLTKRIASDILGYAFNHLRVQRVGTWTPKRNKPARRFVERFGFKREGLVRRGFGSDDAVISSLLASEWAASRFNIQGSRSRNP